MRAKNMNGGSHGDKVTNGAAGGAHTFFASTGPHVANAIYGNVVRCRCGIHRGKAGICQISRHPRPGGLPRFPVHQRLSMVGRQCREGSSSFIAHRWMIQSPLK